MRVLLGNGVPTGYGKAFVDLGHICVWAKDYENIFHANQIFKPQLSLYTASTYDKSTERAVEKYPCWIVYLQDVLKIINLTNLPKDKVICYGSNEIYAYDSVRFRTYGNDKEGLVCDIGAFSPLTRSNIDLVLEATKNGKVVKIFNQIPNSIPALPGLIGKLDDRFIPSLVKSAKLTLVNHPEDHYIVEGLSGLAPITYVDRAETILQRIAVD